ncbi:MAG: 30S ribosomal protein S13 [Phycisphaeraceae bacterium]|nr:30S ribosomal protein S13 [Phycisphaeraceae bacterium]
MPRVAGVDIPDNKPLRIAMRYIHGIGPKLAEDVLKEAGLDPQARAHTLSEDDQARLNQIIDNNYAVEGGLRRKVQQEIQRLKEIRCYRGDRHKRGLPARGQRTRTNARTRKGRKKTVAGKKGVKG